VRERRELVFISQSGMVQRTSVRGISRYGRASQGVRVMSLRDDDQVSAVALVVESEAATAAQVAGDAPAAEGPIELSADSAVDAPDAKDAPDAPDAKDAPDADG